MKYCCTVVFWGISGAFLAISQTTRASIPNCQTTSGAGEILSQGRPRKAAIPFTAQAQSAFVAIPFAGALSSPVPLESYVVFVREGDGSYLSLQYGVAPPYPLQSPSSALTEWLSAGLKSLLGVPSGPAGTGTQSQVCALADLDGNGLMGFAEGGPSWVELIRSTDGISATSLIYPIGLSVNSVFFADFNGDGNADLAVAFDGGGDPGGIAILLGKGDGTFAAPVIYARGIQATRFAVFDLNHDGALDIATVSLDQKVTVLLGKGDGTFLSPVQYTVGTGSGGGSGHAIAIADFNGDGNPDIVAGGTAGILLGNGDGTFRAGPPLPAVASGTLIWAFAAGDLNGDGKMDLVYADVQNQVVVPLFGNGDGTFQTGQAYVVSQLPDSLVLADFNHDGRLDIINATGDARIFGPADQSDSIDIFLNNGDGTFQGPPTYFALPNSEASSYGFSLVTGLAVADFGGTSPGVLSSGEGALTLFVGNGKGGFQAPQSVLIPGGASGPIAAADFNGDGKADAAVVQASGNIAILPGAASGFAAPVTISSGGVNAASIASGDFSGDGKADLAIVGQGNGSSAGTLAILKGNGDGTFQAPVTLPAGISPFYLSAVDLNGDGKLDLIFSDSGANGMGGGIYVALNTGGGTFQGPVKVFSGVYPAFGIADINGDGKLDLVASSAVVNSSNGVVSWLPGNGDGTFQAPVTISTSDAGVTAILVKDFNGDGHADIVLAHQANDTTFLAGNGNGTFSAEIPFLTTGEPTILQTADLNSDGKPDLIVAGLTVTVLIDKVVPIATATVVSAANSAATAIAPGSLATAFGADLANEKAGGASLPLPTNFGGTSISILDSAGNTSPAPLLYVIPTQVNFEVPPGVAIGAAQATVTSGDGTQSIAKVQIAAVAPGLFEANPAALAAGYVVLYHADNTQTVEQLFKLTSAGAVQATPVSLGTSTDRAFLFLFGTGIQEAGASGVKVTVGGANAIVSFAGPQGQFVGVDQVNVQLPASLKGKANVPIKLTANGIAANPVNITIQ